jgi:hypothetical protein
MKHASSLGLMMLVCDLEEQLFISNCHRESTDVAIRLVFF